MPAKPKRAHPGLRLALIRQIHVYVSVFVAPSLLFFALTGALQTFRVPDRKDAPVVLAKLARVHRDDVFAVKPPPKPATSSVAKPAPPKPKPKPKPKEKASTTAVKWFFALTSVAIAVTTLLGMWMAVVYARRKAVIWALLIVGALVPIVLLAL